MTETQGEVAKRSELVKTMEAPEGASTIYHRRQGAPLIPTALYQAAGELSHTAVLFTRMSPLPPLAPTKTCCWSGTP